MSGGILVLVGAGPGDPELLTLKAIKELNKADVILYDSLVNTQVFNLLETNPELVFVGKRKGLDSISQEAINDLILLYLGRGLRVVRLKGGDPLFLARGIEELELASKHSFPCEIVPGLTSGLASASLGAFSLTKRGASQAVLLSTAHELSPELIDLWNSVLVSGSTLVLYMGLSNVVKLCAILAQSQGLDCPAAAISAGSLENEKIIFANLETLPQLIIDRALVSPALIYLGKNLYQADLQVPVADLVMNQLIK